jgi:hypothetical protein
MYAPIDLIHYHNNISALDKISEADINKWNLYEHFEIDIEELKHEILEEAPNKYADKDSEHMHLNFEVLNSITLEDVSMLKVGAQCVVTIDGVKYETTIRENVNLTIGTGVNTYDIGIGSWMHLNMSPAIVRVVEMTDDCPFALLLNDNSLMFVHEAADATNDTHKVGVCVKNYELKKLDAKYLPDNIATTEYVNSIAASKPKITTVTLPAANWTGATNPWSQEVTINGLTATCKIDPQLTALQIVELQNEEITLMFQNDNGVATAWAIGNKPTEDYTLQILLTEVEFV